MAKVLVTGGSGFIGSALVKSLLKNGHQVRVLDNLFRGSLGRLESVKDDIEIITADIRDREAVMDACKGIDVIHHLAYINGTELFYKIPDLILEVGILGAMWTLEGAIKHGVGTYILASTGEVYNVPTKVPTDETERIIIPDVKNPRFSYSGGKIASELLTLHLGGNRGLDVRIFRPHNVYGPEMGYEHVIPQFVGRMSELKASKGNSFDFPIQGTGEETRSFVYVEDAANGIVLIQEKGSNGEIYHLGTQDEITIADLAKATANHMDVNISLQPGELLAGSTPRRCPDISKLRAIGYEPKFNLDQGLSLTVPWYVNNPKPAT